MTSSFDYVISLGENCRTAMSLRELGLRNEAFPFDWHGIRDWNIAGNGGFEKKIELICENFSFFFDQDAYEEFYETWKTHHRLILNKKTGLQFLHEFPKDKTIDEHFNVFIEKYKKRIYRIYDVLNSEKKVLFVFIEFFSRLTSEEIVRAYSKMKEKFSADIHFLIISYDDTLIKNEYRREVLGNIYRYKINNDFSNDAIKNQGNIGNKVLYEYIIKQVCLSKDTPQKTNPVSICFASNNTYSPYLATSIQSIISNASHTRIYNIYILHSGIKKDTIDKIISMSTRLIKIQFINISNIINKYNFFISGHFTVETYFRFFIPLIFRNIDKIIYLDCDLIVERDISYLFDINFTDSYLAAAVKDIDVIRTHNETNNSNSNYLKNVLGLKNIENYFQAGVLLLNLKQMRNEDITSKFFSLCQKLSKPKFADQDILNVVLENRVIFLDTRWNVEYHILMHKNWEKNIPLSLLNDYIKSYHTPWIVHFAGSIKPWQIPTCRMAPYFWKYSSKTSCYEEIIYNCTKYNVLKNIKNILKLLKYTILSKIMFGKMQKKYKQKKNTLLKN